MGALRKDGAKAGKPAAKSQSLADHAYELLRREIITCALAPGTEISEQDLAQRLSMSKTPVREALSRLIQDGLAEIFPRRGYRVTPVTVKDVNDLFVIRSNLEGLAAELAVKRASDDDIERIAKLAAGVPYSRDQHVTVAAFIEANDRFHIALAEASGVPRLAAHITSYLEESARIFYMGAVARDIAPETQGDHQHIVEALRLRDADKARAGVMQHCENTRRGLLTALVIDSNSSLLL